MEGSDAVEWILEIKIETNVKSRNYDQLETVRKIAKKELTIAFLHFVKIDNNAMPTYVQRFNKIS